MARGPFQGTFQQGIRPTVVTAPDALIFLNGESDILGCPRCRRRFDWNKYITTVQVDLSVQSVPGSASFSLSIPRHAIDEFFFDGNPLITPMMEVEIYAKGYFIIEGLPQYYPIFWGLITEVSDSYSAGEHTVSVSCSDILKWWELCRMNVNPAFTQAMGQTGRSLFGNTFSGTNPYDIIWSLAQQSFGDIIVGSGSLLSEYREKNQKSTFKHAMADIMIYWEDRFRNIRSNLLLYGTRGNAVRGDYIAANVSAANENNVFNPQKPEHQPVSQLVRQANGGDSAVQMVFDPTDSGVTAFRTQFMNAGQVNFWQAEYQTKLELANAAKECIGFEFYMDVTGDIVFKPPFYNLDVLSNKPVSWIQDIDVIDWDLSESEAEVVTQLQIQGAYGGNIDYGFGEEMTPCTSVTDYHLLRKYGWRVETFNSEFMASPLHMFYMGLDLLDKKNAQRFRGTVNIPLRPELRLGFPIYVASKDQIWYLQGISHNIQFGGRAQTTLTLTAKRSKFVAPRGIGTIKAVSGGSAPTAKQLSSTVNFEADVGEAAQLPSTNYPEKPGDADPYAPLIMRHPKTGRIVGYPNVVMAYTRPFAVPDNEMKKVLGERPEDRGRGAPTTTEASQEEQNKGALAELNEFQQVYKETQQDKIRKKHFTNRYSYGLSTAGVYTYLYDQTAVIKEMLLVPKSRVKFPREDVNTFQGETGMIRPVSDERGFEVIGHYKYGRGVSLRDGSLVTNVENPSAKNSKADVRPQVAISGELFETLTAQSQGLVDFKFGPTGSNPAYAISTLAPDGSDLQTAGIVNPTTGKPEFVNTADNFVNVAPLGSPEQVGAPVSVEASQMSRALTLAEMSVLEAIAATDDCGCLMGRADLSFINVGYNVKVLSAKPAQGSPAVSQQQAAIEAQQALFYAAVEGAGAVAKSLAEKDPISADETPEQTRARIQAAVTAAQEAAITEIASAEGTDFDQVYQSTLNGAETAESSEPVTEPDSPVIEGPALTQAEAATKVENFLAGLYAALDGPHQEYEKTLRGEYAPGPPVNPVEIRFGAGFNPQDLGGFSPPFSPNRTTGGSDAITTRAQMPTANLESAWGALSNDVMAPNKRTEMEAEKARLELHVTALQAEVQRRSTPSTSGGLVVSEADTSMKDLAAELDKATQDLANVNQSLSTLNREYPP
jgi:hypothetical protein